MVGLSRYGATSPDLLRWFSSWNEGKGYADGVKPFGFLYALHAKKRGSLHPIAPFDSTPEISVAKAFDRVTGEAIPISALQTFAEALADYHLSPESKFRNGEGFDIGRTERRHVQATAIELIGKEADRFEEAFLLGARGDLTIHYGSGPALADDLLSEIAAAAEVFGDAAVMRATGIPRAAVARVRCGEPTTTRASLANIRSGLAALSLAAGERERLEAEESERLWSAVLRAGSLRKAAQVLQVDFSNLNKRLRRGVYNRDD